VVLVRPGVDRADNRRQPLALAGSADAGGKVRAELAGLKILLRAVDRDRVGDGADDGPASRSAAEVDEAPLMSWAEPAESLPARPAPSFSTAAFSSTSTRNVPAEPPIGRTVTVYSPLAGAATGAVASAPPGPRASAEAIRLPDGSRRSTATSRLPLPGTG
jgi:hypothetical protein